MDANTIPPELAAEIGRVIEMAANKAPWMLVAGPALMVLLRLIRTDLVQSRWPFWDKLPEWAKWVIPFVVSGLGSALVAASAGTGWVGCVVAGVLGGIGVGTAGIVSHHATKKAGEVSMEVALAKDPTYVPGSLRKASSLVIPIPKPK